MAITVEHLTKVYGAQKALDDVSIEVNTGDITGLLGPNGAGKSTLMKIITCFIPPTNGTVAIDGFNIFDHALELRRLVGYLPETNPLYPEMYVREYLMFVAGIYKLPNPGSRVEKMIEITGLGPERKKKIGALSKGYRQRVGLAQALIHDPKVLILDEPTSGLDPNQLVEIRRLIREIGKSKTVLLSTHIMQEVEALCNRVIIIDKGKIVADDPIEELKRKAAGKELLVEFGREVDIRAFEEIPGVRRVVRQSEKKYTIYSDGTDVREKVFKIAVELDVPVLSLSEHSGGMEELFHKLTGGNN
ncbi:MAG: gliding motility-associated ABC transporter ATP-binding subunit GldA [Bacteroidales bacterium]